MRVQTLKDQIIRGVPVKAGAVVTVPAATGAKMIREGLARAVEKPEDKLETK